MLILIVLLAANLTLLLTGMVWTLTVRGHTTRRTGPEIGAEIMQEKMARSAFLEGRGSLFQKAWFWGKGWAVNREAAVSYAEIKAMWRKGSFGALLPIGFLITGMVGSIILGGLLMFLTLPSRIPGVIFLAAGVYGAWIVGNGIHRA